MSNKYRLEKIVDILNIEEEHFDEFLDDMKAYYAMFKPLVKAGVGTPIKYLDFTADGKKEYKVTVLAKQQIKEDNE